jgi:hypothetical protein
LKDLATHGEGDEDADDAESSEGSTQVKQRVGDKAIVNRSGDRTSPGAFSESREQMYMQLVPKGGRR